MIIPELDFCTFLILILKEKPSNISPVFLLACGFQGVLHCLSVYTVLFVCPVIVPPGNPIIEARDEVLSEGNETEMTCTAMSSKPAAIIRWMKGDKELPGTLGTVH